MVVFLRVVDGRVAVAHALVNRIAHHPAARPPHGFLRVLGLGFGLAVTFGNTIGTGILNGPSVVARQLPSPLTFLGLWMAVGIAALIAAPSLAELAAMMPQAGGYYVYARRAFHGFVACVVGWTDWLISCGAIAASAVAFAGQGGALPGIGRTSPLAIAVGMVVCLTIIQLRGIRSGSWVQQAASAAVAALFMVFLIGCFLAPAGIGATTAAPLPAVPILTAVVTAVATVIFAYDGWDGALYFGEEIRNPGRDIPYSIFVGIAVVMLLYVAVNAALLRVLTLPTLASRDSPVQAAAAAVFGSAGDAVAMVATMVVFAGAANACLLIGTRVIVALAAAGDLPRGLAHVNARGTPTAALIATACAAIVFVLLGRTLPPLMDTIGLLILVTATLTFSAVFILRRREPRAPRPYRAWGYPATTGVALGVSIAVLAVSVCADFRHAAYALAAVTVSYPIYRISRRWRSAGGYA
jgi:APA family basic amino acid/polyamine antiporter